MHRTCLALFAAALLTGCATYLPEAIRKAPPKDIAVSEVRRNIDLYKGQFVRWGGTIASVENRKGETWLEIVARELDGDGRPRETDVSQGRFLARITGFLDPAVYAPGREMTVAGTIEGHLTRKIGEYVYTYPVVNVELSHLWPVRVRYPRDYYYYDPFWPYPWYPWSPWYPWGYPYPYSYPYRPY